jgi:hypothetical protein
MEFTQTHLTNIENLARLNYTIRQIAVYIGFDVDEIYEEYRNTESLFRKTYDRGVMTTQIAIEKANLDLATAGNINAIQRHDKKVIERQIREAKERIFGRA